MSTFQDILEESLRRGKSEAGLADYQVRTWDGWHHHQTLSLIALWFLVQETQRGKKSVPAITLPQLRQLVAQLLAAEWDQSSPSRILAIVRRRLRRNELARYYHYKKRKRLPPLRSTQRE